MKIFNSLTKKKDLFEPIESREIKLYVCGITTYDYSHIGHARSLIIFDMVVRYFRMRGYQVTFVRNITNIDDKIIKRAQESSEKPEVLTERFIQILHEDEQALGIVPPDAEPRATQYIPEIIRLIEKLIYKQHAYIGKNGDVYFDIRTFKEYGKLSHLNLDELHAGARLEISKNKRNPLDFVLWKQAKSGEPQWKSPWGKGRPGWHIECSAMSSCLLGQPFDIHGGGVDLTFPHHENEIAQSEAAEEKTFVNLWMHVGLLKINKEKMSQSLGNVISIREALRTTDMEVLRYFLLSNHYRGPLSYSKENLSNSYLALERLYLAMRDLPIDNTNTTETSEYTEQFYEAMDNDFNTPIAFSVLFKMTREINQLRYDKKIEKAGKLATELKYLGSVFGFLNYFPEQFLQGKIVSDIEKIEALIAVRSEARRSGDWNTADDIRDQLFDLGITLEDSIKGTSWRRKH